MPTLDTTAGGASANAYCTVAEADTWHGTQLNSTDWESAANDVKQRAIIMATRLLDEHIHWTGALVGIGQALQWPRIDVYDRTGQLVAQDSIPTFLKNATAELAKWLILEDRFASTDQSRFASVSLPGLSVNMAQGSRAPVVPEHVVSMIQFYGHAKRNTAKLVRT